MKNPKNRTIFKLLFCVFLCSFQLQLRGRGLQTAAETCNVTQNLTIFKVVLHLITERILLDTDLLFSVEKASTSIFWPKYVFEFPITTLCTPQFTVWRPT